MYFQSSVGDIWAISECVGRYKFLVHSYGTVVVDAIFVDILFIDSSCLLNFIGFINIHLYEGVK